MALTSRNYGNQFLVRGLVIIFFGRFCSELCSELLGFGFELS